MSRATGGPDTTQRTGINLFFLNGRVLAFKTFSDRCRV